PRLCYYIAYPLPISLYSFHIHYMLPPRSTLFPCTTLFRSELHAGRRELTILRNVDDDGMARIYGWLPGPDADVIVETLHRIAYPDRKSTRLNSSHVKISYAVFCLKNKIKFIFNFYFF